MQTKIRKWGNSLGLRIPKAFAEEARIQLGSAVDLTVKDGRLVITALRSKRYDLDELLSRVSNKNRHAEVDTGGPAGREVW